MSPLGIMTCAPSESGSRGAGAARPSASTPLRAGRGQTARVIDIHAHLAVAAAESVLRSHAVQAARFAFSSADSDAVNRELFARIGAKLHSIEEHLRDMDCLGIDIQVLSPLPGQSVYVAPPDAAREAARLTNDGIAAAVAQHPDRFAGMGLVPFQTPELAIAEMRRCVRELGLRGVEVPSHIAGRELSEPAFRPVLAAAEELGVLLFLHPLGTSHGERLRDHYLNNILGNPIDSAIAVAHLIFDGVLEQLPGLKVCVAHGGGHAAAYWGRWDHAWGVRPDCRRHIARPPSEYLRRLYFDTLVFDRAQLRFLLSTYGADHLCLGTDYPFDMAEPDPLGLHAELCEADRAAVLGGTAARLLGLDREEWP